MNLDEFAFFNQQLGAMLGDGIPLEGAIGQLCAQMRRGRLRDQLQQVEAAIRRGDDLPAAARAAGLPGIYVQTLTVGLRSGSLPSLLGHIAGYYQRASLLGMQLRGLLVYPTLVLVAMAAVAVYFNRSLMPEVSAFAREMFLEELWYWSPGATTTGAGIGPLLRYGFLLIPLALLAAWLLVLAVPPLRRWFAWRLMVFQYANLSRLASMLAVLLRAGVPLPECLDLVRALHANTPAAGDLHRMRNAVQEGRAGLDELAAECRWLPGLFRWLMAIHKDDPAAGFEQAALLYQRRSAYAQEVLLYVAMPISVVFLGLMVLSQFVIMLLPIMRMLNLFGTF